MRDFGLAVRADLPQRVLPLMVAIEGEGGFATLYPGDAGYESGDMQAAGGRHRSYLQGGCWQYQYEDVQDAEPLYPLGALAES